MTISGDKTTVHGGKEQSFSLDGGYPAETRNDQIYRDRCDQLIQRALEGNNVTIMAFGATGSGKTSLMAGTEDEPGIIPYACRGIFQHASNKSGRDFMISVSYLEIRDEKMTDLLNPHNNNMTIKEHPTKGIFVDGLSELIVKTGEEISTMYDQGTRARKMGAPDLSSHRARAHAVFSVVIEQRERQSSKVGVRSVIQLVDTAGSEEINSPDHSVQAGVMGLQNVLMALGGPRKGGAVPYRDSKLTRYLQESLGGNAITLMFATLSPDNKSHQDSLHTLQLAAMAKNIKNKVKMNLDETNDVIAELRNDISKLRDRIASTSEPNRDDVLKMEDLVRDLQIAKKQTWEEKERASSRFTEERKTNLANKGILEWVMDSMKKGNKEMQEKIGQLHREKDQVSAAYKDKRNLVDQLKSDLQVKIAEYAKYTEKGKTSESENKSRVTAIHNLKEKLKQETEKLKQLKQQLSEIEQKQQLEKEGARAQMTAMKGNAELRQKVELEERRNIESQNKAMISDELERARMDVETEKIEIQHRAAGGKKYGSKEGADLEIQIAELKGDKSVVTMQIQLLQQEKERLARELDEVHRLHKDELEIQQLQHYQTFRNYREMFEEQKVAIEQRYRSLLEDAIQDAVFLSSRNSELVDENQQLRQQINEMKDVVTKLGGRLPSSVERPF